MSKDARLETFIQHIIASLPEDLSLAREDIRKNIRSAVQSALSRLDLVTREEFDVQAELLSRTRAMLDEMEQRVRELEQLRGDKS
ncbi:MAG TPA: accessory factor UbiK family protein [Gammaproteobacteria bacterium]|nr:accessory factor UbiK family protein [Gammaproteobacteria bacterium]